MRGRVGASIVEIITESLYDKPIVVFREYVQNSADSLSAAESEVSPSELAIEIWRDKDNLYFLDNGTGIVPEKFLSTMDSIADSAKAREKNIGYKGIGRLSGLSYCRKLTFVNIVDFCNEQFQTYSIDCLKYSKLRKDGKLGNLQFSQLMKLISTLEEHPNPSIIKDVIDKRSFLFSNRSTGFLVMLDGISPVLDAAISEKGFVENLSWLLPVPFQDELLHENDDSDICELFSELGSKPAFSDESSGIIEGENDREIVLNQSMDIASVPAKSYVISYDGKCINRPIKRSMMRGYLCRSNLERYAVCVHTFSNTGIAINNKNSFSGIRIYIDNILLCDESELIPALQQFGYLSHTVNETIQTVRGIGAIVYIVDKINISANARRTFIDVTDEDSLNFLKLIGEYVENVFQARYAMSDYYSAKRKEETTSENLSELRTKAERALVKLASQEIILEDDSEHSVSFENLPPAEKKRIIKTKLSKKMNVCIKKYIDQISVFSLDDFFDDFLTWLKAN